MTFGSAVTIGPDPEAGPLPPAPRDDFPVVSIYNDPRNTHRAFYDMENIIEPSDESGKCDSGVISGDESVGYVIDLGTSQRVVGVLQREEGSGHPDNLEYSLSGSSWTVAPGAWTGSGAKTFTPTVPIVARFWCCRWLAPGGLHYVPWHTIYETRIDY